MRDKNPPDFDFDDLFDEEGSFRDEAFEEPLDEEFPDEDWAAGERLERGPGNRTGKGVNGAARHGRSAQVEEDAGAGNGASGPVMKGVDHGGTNGSASPRGAQASEELPAFDDGEFENPEEADLPDFDLPAFEEFSPGRPAPRNAKPRQPVARQAARLAYQSGSQAKAGIHAGGPQGAPAPLPPGVEQWIDAEGCSAAMLETLRLMQSLARAAAAAGSEAEAAQLASAAVPLALNLAPGFSTALWPALPALIAGAGAAARYFHQQPRPGAWMQYLPAALVGTVARLARMAAQHQFPGGAKSAGPLAARVLAGQLEQLLPGSNRQESAAGSGAGSGD